MPGQPAWTLTELLECNLPLCWAGGGDCNVGPAQILAAHFFYLSPLGLQPIGFIIKPEEAKKKEAGEAVRFLSSVVLMQEN